MNDASPSLAGAFPPASREQWLKLVDRVLKGASFETLVSETYDGIAIVPLEERARSGRPIAGRAPGTPWQVLQRVDHPDPAKANDEALHDLENGATGLVLVTTDAPAAQGYGLEVSKAAIIRALDGVHLDAGIALELDTGLRSADATGLVCALVQDRGLDPTTVAIRFGVDPLGVMASTGIVPTAWPDASFAREIVSLSDAGFKGPFAAADGRIIHNAGGTEAQELAYVLAVAIAYLRALEAAGQPVEAARRMIFFRLVADTDQFLTMAKFRALRKLWERIEDACRLAPAPIFISAETAWRVMTKRDPHVNMLRATIAVTAAGLAGADAIMVLPFTAALGLPDRFARRIARNTQLILIEESHLARVADPAAGSGAIEALTQKLCAKAWSLFQEIEITGGAWPALERGVIQRHVATARRERQAALSDGRDQLIGTTIFANPAEITTVPLDVARRVAQPAAPDARSIEALVPLRLAEPFEG